jgi:hypothetical protein
MKTYELILYLVIFIIFAWFLNTYLLQWIHSMKTNETIPPYYGQGLPLQSRAEYNPPFMRTKEQTAWMLQQDHPFKEWYKSGKNMPTWYNGYLFSEKRWDNLFPDMWPIV